MKRIFKSLTLALLFSGSALAQDTTAAQPFAPADYYNLKELSSLALSTSGALLAFEQAEVSDDRRSRHTSIWLHRLGESAPQQFTSGKNDSNPLFSPNGKQLLFQGSRPSAAPAGATKTISGLYRIATDGGEATLLLHLEQASIRSVEWYPDNERLLLTLSHKPEVTDPRAKADKEPEHKPDSDFIQYAEYKRQGGYRDERRTTLWQYHIASDTLTRLAADFAYDINNATLSPNGEHIAFTANRHPQARDGGFASDLLLLSKDKLSTIKTGDAYAGQPLWLNNNELAYVQRSDSYAAPAVYVTNRSGSNHKVLASRMDHRPSQMLLAHNALWFIADHQGSRSLFQLALDGSGYQPVTGNGFSLSSLVASSNGQHWAWLRDNETQPAELVRATASATAAPSNNVTSLYDPNEAVLAKLQLTPYERFTTVSSDGQELDVFFLPPSNLAAAKKNTEVPVVLNIKGGPGGMWGHQWFPENQLLAGHGYGVVFVNYRGSTGYGFDYQNSVRFDYGGVDYRDNITALDAVLARYNWLAQDRQFITGGSHGGFLTNWATTQSNRFRAAVTQRSVSNWISEAGTQAFPPLSMQQEFGGTLWENFDYYWNRSPLQFANQVTTPTLIIHSSSDHITPIGQGEEWFYALKANNVPVEMVVFRGEGHGLSRAGKPVNLVERLNQIVAWFERYR